MDETSTFLFFSHRHKKMAVKYSMKEAGNEKGADITD